MSGSVSPLPWTGSKGCIYTTIDAFMPPHKTYVEACMGSAEVFLRKKPVEREIINDYNGDLVKFFRVLQQNEKLAYLLGRLYLSFNSEELFRIEIKIRHLMMLLSALPDIEIVCTDSSECFDDNKAYLTSRLEVEENAKVRKLIKKDIEFLDTIQVEMATARQFFFVARLKGQKEKQTFETANRIESKIAGEGFEVHRLKKPEIKRILALYFDSSLQGEAIPDIDGEQFYEVTDDGAVAKRENA